jgi:probable F420-dependent oxidoreductase
MLIGLNRPINPPVYPVPDIDAAIIAQHAEALGFESIFYGEHPIRPLEEAGMTVGSYSGGVPLFQDTLVALARASAVTSRIKIGSAVFNMPEHNPVLFAKQIASLDLYSKGRVVLGLSVGWSEIEVTLLGGDFARRWEQTRESILIMQALWTQERVEMKGEFYDVPPVFCYPQPASKPWPPILIGSRHANAFPRIVEYADGWMPAFVRADTMALGPGAVREGRRKLDEAAKTAGRDPTGLHIAAIIKDDATPDDLKRFEDASCDRVLISLPAVQTEAEAREVLDRLAQRVL